MSDTFAKDKVTHFVSCGEGHGSMRNYMIIGITSDDAA